MSPTQVDASAAPVQTVFPEHTPMIYSYQDPYITASLWFPSQVTAAALLFIAIPPSLFIFILSLRRGRRTVEWARQCYSFLLPAFGIFNLYSHRPLLTLPSRLTLVRFSVFDTLVFSIKVAYSLTTNSNVQIKLMKAHSYIHPFSRFCDSLAEIFLFLCLTFLGIGLGIARTGYSGRFERGTKIVAYTMAFLLSVLATVSFGLLLWTTAMVEGDLSMDCLLGYTCYQDYNGTYDLRPYLPAMKSNYAFVSITWVLSVVTVIRAFALMAVDNRKTERRLRLAGRCLVLCSVLWLVRTTFTFAMEIKSAETDKWRHGHGNLAVENIVNIPLSVWTMFAIFSLLYVLGSHKQTGLYLLATNDPAAQKNLHINQPMKSFQDIEIPMHPEHTRTGLSSQGQDDSPVSPHSPSMPGPMPMVPAPQPAYQASQASYQTAQSSFTGSQEDRIESAGQVSRQSYLPEYQPQGQVQTVEPVNRRLSRLQDADWARPPSTDPPPHFRNSSSTSHDEFMGFNHQADGYTPSAPLPYPMKQ
ncbi:hypothetical protein HJFPF1_08802 [Paramyrothecium foliicola]|nr:hypothetical protein HJFPF1_08802 [Paramyrothecium foliicola]